MASTLTKKLLTLKPDLFVNATKHSFLEQAGKGTLSSELLCEWLVQDKYYQFAYVNFIGRLVAKIDLTSRTSKDGEQAKQAHEQDDLAWKTLNVLMQALQAIKTEIEFYDQVVNRYSLLLQSQPEKEVTRNYRRLFEESSAEGAPLVDGLTVLWATELVYLKAWSHAKEMRESSGPVRSTNEGSAAMDALHHAFIPNWTSPEFIKAVESLANVADLWAEREVSQRCEGLWQRVLELESDFWPSSQR